MDNAARPEDASPAWDFGEVSAPVDAAPPDDLFAPPPPAPPPADFAFDLDLPSPAAPPAAPSPGDDFSLDFGDLPSPAAPAPDSEAASPAPRPERKGR